MPKFSNNSMAKLLSCHPDLQLVMAEVVKHFDCTIVCGRRGKQEQEDAFKAGNSKAHFGQSPHNFFPSLAVDVVPYPVEWQETERMTYFAGFVMATALKHGVELKWGGDWDRDTHLSDNRFNDFPHFELANWRDMDKRL